MSVAKLKASNSQVAVKSDEGNESLDTIIRHAIGKEPFLSFSRAGDSPVQWIQLLHALDQPELPGWPLLSPLKVQMQKCDKCSREFCSPINHRRHIRVDHRPRKLDSSVDRDKLKSFWDELSLDKAKETVSFENATLEEVAGSSIIASLTSLVKKQGLSSLPQVCVKAGSALLSFVQGEFHERIPSEKLFSILDDASEKTFLCGKAEAVQKYVFDGEAGKIDLEKNMVACTSFLVEQKLVKAWHDHKDLEAMEAQELLLLEEDAAKGSGKGLHNLGQTRKPKTQRKVKKKEGKAKAEVKENFVEMQKNVPSTETATTIDISGFDSQSPQAHTDSGPNCGHAEPGVTQNVKRKEEVANAEVRESTADTPMNDVETPDPVDVSGSSSNFPHRQPDQVPKSLERLQHSNTGKNVVAEAPSGSGCGHAEPGTAQNIERGAGRRDMAPRRQVPSKLRGIVNASFHGSHPDSRAAPMVNVNKVWSPKPKPDFDGESSKIRVQSEQNKKCEVFIIGSIPVTLGRSAVQQEDGYLAEHIISKKNNVPEKHVKQNSTRGGTHRPPGKHWRPVSRQEVGAPLPVQNRYRESDTSIADRNGDSREESEGTSKYLSIAEIKAFLAQRSKEAIAGENVKLILSPAVEPPRHTGQKLQNESQTAAATIPSKFPSTTRFLKPPSSSDAARPEKGVATRYIRKDKTAIVS